jgi:hypothetical protein
VGVAFLGFALLRHLLDHGAGSDDLSGRVPNRMHASRQMAPLHLIACRLELDVHSLDRIAGP